MSIDYSESGESVAGVRVVDLDTRAELKRFDDTRSPNLAEGEFYRPNIDAHHGRRSSPSRANPARSTSPPTSSTSAGRTARPRGPSRRAGASATSGRRSRAARRHRQRRAHLHHHGTGHDHDRRPRRCRPGPRALRQVWYTHASGLSIRADGGGTMTLTHYAEDGEDTVFHRDHAETRDLQGDRLTMEVVTSTEPSVIPVDDDLEFVVSTPGLIMTTSRGRTELVRPSPRRCRRPRARTGAGPALDVGWGSR